MSVKWLRKVAILRSFCKYIQNDCHFVSVFWFIINLLENIIRSSQSLGFACVNLQKQVHKFFYPHPSFKSWPRHYWRCNKFENKYMNRYISDSSETFFYSQFTVHLLVLFLGWIKINYDCCSSLLFYIKIDSYKSRCYFSHYLAAACAQ